MVRNIVHKLQGEVNNSGGTEELSEVEVVDMIQYGMLFPRCSLSAFPLDLFGKWILEDAWRVSA